MWQKVSIIDHDPILVSVIDGEQWMFCPASLANAEQIGENITFF